MPSDRLGSSDWFFALIFYLFDIQRIHGNVAINARWLWIMRWQTTMDWRRTRIRMVERGGMQDCECAAATGAAHINSLLKDMWGDNTGVLKQKKYIQKRRWHMRGRCRVSSRRWSLNRKMNRWLNNQWALRKSRYFQSTKGVANLESLALTLLNSFI